MKIHLEYTEHDIMRLIAADVERKTGSPIKPSDVKVEVKSTQNFKSEWEKASFRATYDKQE